MRCFLASAFATAAPLNIHSADDIVGVTTQFNAQSSSKGLQVLYSGYLKQSFVIHLQTCSLPSTPLTTVRPTHNTNNLLLTPCILDDTDRSASDPSGKTDFITPEFEQNRQQESDAMRDNYAQSVPDRHGGVGNTDVPGDTTSHDTLMGGSHVPHSGRTGGVSAGREIGRDLPTGTGDYGQSAPDSQGRFASSDVPGNTSSHRTVGQGYDNDNSTGATGKPGMGQRMMGTS